MKLYSHQDALEFWNNNALANRINAGGGDMEDVAIALHKHAEKMTQRLMGLEAIAPRRVNVDGVEYVYRCPDHLVPVDVPQTTFVPGGTRPPRIVDEPTE